MYGANRRKSCLIFLQLKPSDGDVRHFVRLGEETGTKKETFPGCRASTGCFEIFEMTSGCFQTKPEGLVTFSYKNGGKRTGESSIFEPISFLLTGKSSLKCRRMFRLVS